MDTNGKTSRSEIDTDANGKTSRSEIDTDANGKTSRSEIDTDANGKTSRSEIDTDIDDAVGLSPDEKKSLFRMKKSHTCKDEDVQSVDVIRKSSRPCPKCKVKIFRIAGCDTMWCTVCNTGFNWRTGLVITDTRELHNPHYVDFIRKNPTFRYVAPSTNDEKRDEKNEERNEEKKTGQNHGAQFANPCDRVTLDNVPIPSIYYANMLRLPRPVQDMIYHFQQEMGHVRNYSLHQFTTRNQYDPVEYALHYVSGKWDAKRLRIMIEHHDRFSQTNLEYIDVIITWLIVLNDLFRQHNLTSDRPITRTTTAMNLPMPTLEQATEFIDHAKKITEYTNTQLTEMNKMYKRVTKLIRVDPPRDNV